MSFKCRICGNEHVRSVLDLKKTPLANSLLKDPADAVDEKWYPLELVYCDKCTLLQINETVPGDELFSDYLYFSSFSTTMLEHSKSLAEKLIDKYGLDKASLVGEIASNDGYLLKNYVARGIPVAGVEPAGNIAKVANEAGVRTFSRFFNKACANDLVGEGLRADIIHANNVLAHVDQLHSFVEGIEAWLAPEGVAVIEFPYLIDMIEKLEFDQVYHEHLCYFSLTSVKHLFEMHGLKVHDVERIAIHGGSLRVYLQKQSGSLPVTDAVTGLLQYEQSEGVSDYSYYESFSSSVEQLGSELRQLLSDLSEQGKEVAGYGASAKGSTLMNYFQISSDQLKYVVDRSTVKQGLYTPGTHLEIRPPEVLLEEQPDYLLLLTWNFKDEIMEQQKAYRDAGGQFIVPLPAVEII